MTCGVVSECAEGRLWRSPSFTNAEDHSLGRVRRVASQGPGGQFSPWWLCGMLTDGHVHPHRCRRGLWVVLGRQEQWRGRSNGQMFLQAGQD